MMCKLFFFLLVMALSLLSLNSGGLRSPTRMHSAFQTLSWDVLCLQETHWSPRHVRAVEGMGVGTVYCALGTARSCGVAVLVKQGVVGASTLRYSDPAGRFLVVDFAGSLKFRLINVYAPNEVSERVSFFESLFAFVNEDTVLMGDFNVCLSSLDVSVNNSYSNDMSRSVLFDKLNIYNMVEIWRLLNTTGRCFSRKQVVNGVLKQSRIDLCFVTQSFVKLVSNVVYDPLWLSDHCPLRIGVGCSAARRNGGLWILNNSILDDELFVKKVNNLFDGFDMELECIGSVVDWWPEAKRRIKRLAINFCKHKRWVEQVRERKLRERLQVLTRAAASQTGPVDPEYLTIKAELDNLEIKRCRGAILRAKASYTVQGERSTAYFFGLEKQKQTKCFIESLVDKSGKVVTGKSGILDTVYDFYCGLFDSAGVSVPCAEAAVDALKRRLRPDEAEQCDAPVSLEEVRSAIAALRSGKSPGEDGLTCEFYKRFARRLAPILLRLFLDMQAEGRTAEGFSVSVVTLVFKKGNRSNLGNYRPISLLNVDYKIIAKVLSNRLRGVIGSVVGPTQAYSIPGRDISDVLLSLKYVLSQMHSTGGIHVSVDFSKAFDRVEHGFLFSVLGKLGFGSGFIDWLRLLYMSAVSKVKVNGSLTDCFPLKRSVRQGCPLSAFLYSLVAEPLAAMLYRETQVSGVRVPGGREVKIFQYADDTNLLLRDTESLESALHVLNVYCLASGARVNFEKSFIAFCGSVAPAPVSVPLRDAGSSYRVLGVLLGRDQKECAEKMWEKLIGDIKGILTLWKFRNLTLKGKVLVVNSLCLSKLVHALTVYEMGGDIANRISLLVSHFLWKRERGLIAHSVMINEVSKGGLKLFDIVLKKQSLRVKIIQRFLDRECEAVWKDFFSLELQKLGAFKCFNLCLSPPVPSLGVLSAFEKEVLMAWRALRGLAVAVPGSWDQLKRMPLRFNPDLLSSPPDRRESILSGIFERAGIFTVGDVFDRSGQFSVDFIRGKFQAHCIVFRKLYVSNLLGKIKECLFKKWSHLLGSSTSGVSAGEDPALDFDLSVGAGTKRLSVLHTRTFYSILLAGVARKPAAEHAWSRSYPVYNTTSIWANTFNWYTAPQVSNFAFKLKHRLIYTRSTLHAIHPGRYGAGCPVCGESYQDLHHLLITCPAVRPFWTRVQDLLARRLSWRLPPLAAPGGDDQLHWFLLFGPFGGRSGANVHLARIVMETARYTIYLVRNIYHFDGRSALHWPLFRGLLYSHLRHLLTAVPNRFRSVLAKDANLISLNPSGSLELRFGLYQPL